MNVIEYIIGSIAPHSCVQCGHEGALLCAHCIQNLPKARSCCYVCNRTQPAGQTCIRCRQSTPLIAVTATTPYASDIKRLLHMLKYDRAGAAACDVAAAIARQLTAPPLPDGLVVTHAPTAQVRIRQRGYDQSALIAKDVARRIGVPYTPLLQRLGMQRQVGQKRAARKEQMISAFRPVHVPIMQNKPVLIIDDVLTTGATLEAAAQTLQQAGAGEVRAAVFAQA